MKKRIYFGLLLIFFLFVFDRGFSFLFRELNYSFYSKIKIKKNIFGKAQVIKKNFYEMMIFGTSRTKDSIHPLYLYNLLGLKSYKEAKPSRYPRYYYHFYKRFKSVYGKPKYLLYGIDYFIFNLKTSGIHLIRLNKKRKIKRLNFGEHMNESSRIFSRVSFLFRAKKKIDNTISDILYKYSLDWDSSGNKKNAVGIDKFVGKKRVLRAEFRQKPKTWEKFEYITSEYGEGKYLKMLFDELEKDEVTVFLIGIPEYIGTYRSNFQQEKYIENINSLIRGRKNFWFLNYDHPGRFDLSNPEYFTNGGYGVFNSHMSYFGALHFNGILAEDISNIIKTGLN